MARIQGRFGTLEISTDNEETYFNIGCLGDISLTAANAEVEVTCRDDGPFQAFLPGRISGGFSIDGFYDEADPGQQLLIDAVFTPEQVTLRYRPAGAGTGAREYIARATVTDFGIDSELEGGTTFTSEFNLSGPWAASFQS